MKTISIIQFATIFDKNLDYINPPIDSRQMEGRDLVKTFIVRVGIVFQQCADCFDMSMETRQMKRCFLFV